jgi:N-acetyltransferase
VFDLLPTLEGELVRLRPLRPDDFDALYAVAADPLIWAQHPDKARSTLDGFRSFFDGAMASGGALLASDATTGQVIGSSRYHGFDAGRREVEIGWTFLARSHWGGPWNREMKSLMVQHALQHVDRVLFLVDPGNHRSQRALAKIGAARVGTREVRGAPHVLFVVPATG